MPEDDGRGSYPAGAGGLDKLAPLQAHGLAADDSRHVEPGDRTDRDIDEGDVTAEHHGQHDDEEDEGNGVEDVDDAHHDRIDPALEKTGRGAPGDADDEADE